MHLDLCSHFFCHHCCALFSCPLFSKPVFTLHWKCCAGSPLLVFFMLSSPPPSVFLFPHRLPPLWSLTPISPAVWSWFKGLGSDLVSFCLCSPWSLKSFFIPPASPCEPVFLRLTLLVLKCQCPCPCTLTTHVLQVHGSTWMCSNCYWEFAIRGRLRDSWKDRFWWRGAGTFRCQDRLLMDLLANSLCCLPAACTPFSPPPPIYLFYCSRRL